MIHPIDSQNDWMPLSVTFTAKFELVFILTFANGFSESFHFKASRKTIGSSKAVLGILNSPPFERSACFYVTISKSFKRFQYFNFETSFLENETTLFFWKICSSFRTSSKDLI